MRGRSPVTVWRPPARAHTLAHTQSNCRVGRKCSVGPAGCPAPRWYIAHCVLQSVLSFTRLRIARRPAAARRGTAGWGVLRSCRCRPRGAREAYNAGERTALRAASAAAPPDATNFAECAFFARFPAFPVLRLSPTDRRGRPRDRRLGLVKRACGSSRAERQSGSPHARRGPGYSVRRSARRQASRVSLPRVSRLATTNSVT